MTTLFIEGLALWSSLLPGWEAARAAFRGEAGLASPPAKRPAPQMLAAAERRRAPDTVALALEVASAAVEQSGLDAKDLPSLFVSAHGDLAINDHMCTTLASEPTLISPTKFHNSVLNAAAGYWTIGTGCLQASSALTAFEHSFAAGLLEAGTQVIADQRPMLLVGFDIAACGALASVTRSEELLAVALVLAPQRSERSVAALDWSLRSGPTTPASLHSAAARALTVNAMADALPLFEALARQSTEAIDLPLSATLSLTVRPTAHPKSP